LEIDLQRAQLKARGTRDEAPAATNKIEAERVARKSTRALSADGTHDTSTTNELA
jgi:hypothetical protein